MSKFFDLDGPFSKFGSVFFDIMILSLLWLVFTIPIITSGAATTALFYVVTRRISGREGYLISDFWRSFRLNFKQATFCWLLIMLIAWVVFINITNINRLGSAKNVVLPIQLGIALETGAISLYVFPIIARFKLSLKDVFKNAFFLANRHFLTTLMLMSVGVGVILLSLATVLFSLMAMGVYAFIASHLIMRVFRKYNPGMDRDDELE